MFFSCFACIRFIFRKCKSSLFSSSDISISFRVPQNHQGICPQESVYCENKCGARMMRKLLSQHTMTECPKRTQPCKYCGKEFVYDTIQVRDRAQQTSTDKSFSALSDLDCDVLQLWPCLCSTEK